VDDETPVAIEGTRADEAVESMFISVNHQEVIGKCLPNSQHFSTNGIRSLFVVGNFSSHGLSPFWFNDLDTGVKVLFAMLTRNVSIQCNCKLKKIKLLMLSKNTLEFYLDLYKASHTNRT